MTAASPADLERIALAIGREVRDILAAGRADAQVAATKSSAVDVVTQMDIAAEALIRQRLAELRPHDAILGEEDGATAGTSGVTWVVDPIDGTVNYLYGIPHWAVSIAAVTGGSDPARWRIEAGAIVDALGTECSAARGGGARRDGVRIVRGATDTGDTPNGADGGADTGRAAATVPAALAAPAVPAVPLAMSLVATGFQYTADVRAAQGAVVAALLPQVRDIRRLGAASVDLCHVAAGLVDVYYEHGLQPWDFAAGALIAVEAGLRVDGFDGPATQGRLLIVAPHDAWDTLRDALARAGAGEI